MRHFMTAIGAGVGSVAVMGGATFVVAGTALTVVKRVNKQRKMKLATECTVCKGNGFQPCQVCLGKGIILSRKPVSLKRLAKKLTAGEDEGSIVYTGCPACGSTLTQRCTNCLGDKKV